VEKPRGVARFVAIRLVGIESVIPDLPGTHISRLYRIGGNRISAGSKGYGGR
jgi:hypothetical protein